MPLRQVICLACVVVLAGTVPTFAAEGDCRQQNGVYRDNDNAFELTFQPAESDAQAATHRFSVRVLKTGAMLDGYVMPSDPVDRSNGIIFYNCPEGDATGKDIAACTVWQGVVYGHEAGKIETLPSGDQVAVSEILLPDFGPAIRRSDLWAKGKADVAPWDVLTLKGCAK